ncbi:MAG: BamA/TamA family outer membrane protein [Acidobacteria bacterium]|jgi:outer membrane protein insertion porin family|nr:BamA/TamA family outer membrane protein [Acidobacteriota bacterium]
MRIGRVASCAAGALTVVGVLAVGPVAAQEAAPSGEVPASCNTVRSVEVRGSQKMSADAVRFDLGIKPGDPWDEARIDQEFRRFWQRGYFSDLRFFRRCEPDGAVLVVEIKDRPTVLSVTYGKNKVANQQAIEDYFKERNFTFTVGTPLDRKRVWKAQQLIKELLGTKGYLDAKVDPVVKEVSASARSITFKIVPGGKTQIKDLDFTGNDHYSDAALKKQLKLTSEYQFYWPFGKKSLYHPLKFQQDVNNILQYYRDRGYLDVDVRPPIVDVRSEEGRQDAQATQELVEALDGQGIPSEAAAAPPADAGSKLVAADEAKRQAELSEKEADEAAQKAAKIKKWVYVTVPIVEGPVYTLGSVTFEGNTVFTSDTLRATIPLPDGATLSDSAIEAGMRVIRSIYGRRGYVYVAVTRRIERKEGQFVADVVITIDEDKAYTVRQIDFAGNTTTNDTVLRREFNVAEGDVLDRALLDRSMQKIQQLGYWVPAEEPTLAPVEGTDQVDVIVRGEEQSRNEVQVGGGYSELEGAFFLASYQTRNFLGRGETLGLNLSIGGRSNQAALNFVEPWLFGKPITLGISIFRRSYDFGVARDIQGNTQNLNQAGTGGSITIGRRLGDFSQISLIWSFEQVEASTIDLSAQFATTETILSNITPVFNYKRVNNYLRPTYGYELSVLPTISLKALGSDLDYFKPRLAGTIWRPFGPKFFAAAHGELAWIWPFREVEREPGYVDGVPRFQRYFIGGDIIGPRIFETRTISPVRFIVQLDQNGNPIVGPGGNPSVALAQVGGSKMALVQFEAGVLIGKSATLVGFFDAGGAYDNGVDINWDQARASAGLEFRIFLPVFQAPIRLIYGWPIQEQPFDQTSQFQFSIGLPF